MPGIITNTTNITLNNVTNLANSSSVSEFFIKVNQQVYEGWMFFIILLIIWVVLFISFNKYRDQILSNLMYSGGIVSILSFILRGVNMSINGVWQGLLTDHQLWIFPVITILITALVYATKETNP